MKGETVLLIAVGALILYEYSKQQNAIKSVTCGQPGSDPVFCALLQEAQS